MLLRGSGFGQSGQLLRCTFSGELGPFTSPAEPILWESDADDAVGAVPGSAGLRCMTPPVTIGGAYDRQTAVRVVRMEAWHYLGVETLVTRRYVACKVC